MQPVHTTPVRAAAAKVAAVLAILIAAAPVAAQLEIVGQPITWSNPVESVDWFTCCRWLARHGLCLPTRLSCAPTASGVVEHPRRSTPWPCPSAIAGAVCPAFRRHI